MGRFAGIGLAVWLVATLAIRLGGGRVFRTDDTTHAVLLFAITALVIGAAISLLVRRLENREAGLRAAVLVVLPGMLLDTGSVLWFPAVFPNLPASAGMPFASLLLWAYGVALLAAVWPHGARPR